MDENEQAQRQAEHAAASLHNLGWETGAGATVWARTIQDELARHEEARERWATDSGIETWERLHGSAFAIVVAVDQVLTFERRISLIIGGDAELAEARARFDFVCSDVEDLRNLVMHLDEYATGEGRRQKGKVLPHLPEPFLSSLLYWGNGGSTVLSLGDRVFNLRAAAKAAIELASVVERVRARHLEHVEREANAAMRRRYGLPPE